MNNAADIDNLFESLPLPGIYGLWLRIFALSVNELQRVYGDTAAQAFLYDPDNQFFDYVSERLGYEPAAMRERIRKTAGGRRGVSAVLLSARDTTHEPREDKNAATGI